MLWMRKQYLDYMTYKEYDKPLFTELFGPLVGLEKEWEQQGATFEELNLTAFDFDYVNTIKCGGDTGVFNKIKEVVLEETDEYKIARDKYGRTVKLFKKSATVPLPLDHPVKTYDDWLKIKPMFEYTDARVNIQQAFLAKKLSAEGCVVCGSIPGGFDLPRQLMGEEQLCYAFYDQPELVHDILDTIANMSCMVMDKITDIVTVDHVLIHEDLAGKSGPLIGPIQIEEFIKPYFVKLTRLLKEKGTLIISVDSDGYVEPLLDIYSEYGINEIYPMEPAAGMDVVRTKQKYGHKFAFKGGIDKMALLNSKNDILRELEYKFNSIMLDGGIAFGLDHRIPNGVSLDNYRFYVKTAREMLGLPAYEKAKNPSWSRMAF